MSPSKIKRVAITGASGFIGRALVLYLQRKGIHVVAVSRSLGCSMVPGCEYKICHDYADVNVLSELFSSCDVIVHLAGLAHQFTSSRASLRVNSFIDANLKPLVSVARAARAAQVGRIIFISSIGVNGPSTFGRPFSDEDLPAPIEPYSVSKLQAESALASELASSSTDWVVLRPPLIYGPGCPGNLRRLIRLVSAVPILPFGAIHRRKTFLSLDRLVDAIYLAAFAKSVSRRVFVISDSKDISLAEVVRSLQIGLGRNESWRLFSCPPLLFSIAFSLLGKGSLWSKLSCELRVDPSAFCHATGWVPCDCPCEGLRQAAESYLEGV